MERKKIWLSSPHMGGGEMKYIQNAFDENWIAPLGPNVNGFEEDLQEYLGISHAAALSSGTAAIHLALILLGVERDDEVIVSSFTFSATVNPIIYQSAIPIFIDSEKDTWNMDPDLLEVAIKDRVSKGKKPKAIILVHLYGMPSKLDEIISVANKYNIPIIEDAAEALGSEYKGRKLGTFGKFGILSFNGNKIITTSGGGALISNDKDLIFKARFLSTQARDNAPHYQHSQIGYNYRMSNIIAGIGRGQMEVLEERIRTRREINKMYIDLFNKKSGIKILTEPNENYYSNFWLTTLLIEKESFGMDREELRLLLKEMNIESRPLWKPMHMQPVFKDYPFYSNGVSEELFTKGLCMPSGTNMSENDIKRIIQVLNKL